MQNRRIIDKVAASIGVTIRRTIVSNSFLGICAHIRRAGWAGNVPHTFFLFGPTPDVIALDLIEPVHSEAIGLVLSDRDPLSPMASALLGSTLGSKELANGEANAQSAKALSSRGRHPPSRAYAE